MGSDKEYFRAEIEHQIYTGDTALHIAAAAYEADRVRQLVNAGASVSAANRRGAQPLHRAVRNRCAAAVEALLDAGADRYATNRRGSTAAQLARWTTGRGGSGSAEARAQQQEIVRLLA